MEYQIRVRSDGRYYWRLWYDGEIIATAGQGHPSIQDCRDEIARVKLSTEAPIRVTN